MKRVLAARLIVFAVACVWVLGLGAFSILYWDHARWLLLGAGYGTWLETVFNLWFSFTIICVGLYVAYRGFRYVGKWEREDTKSK